MPAPPPRRCGWCPAPNTPRASAWTPPAARRPSSGFWRGAWGRPPGPKIFFRPRGRMDCKSPQDMIGYSIEIRRERQPGHREPPSSYFFALGMGKILERGRFMAQRIRSMTEGSPIRLLISFALPLMVGNVFQQLYTVVDTAVVGAVCGGKRPGLPGGGGQPQLGGCWASSRG